MRIFYLLISLISCVSFAADDQRDCFVSGSSSSSSGSVTRIYTMSEKRQNALDIFSSLARDARFSHGQKEIYSRLALRVSSLMQMLNPSVNPKPVITKYHHDTQLKYAESCAKIWFEEARFYAANVLRKSMQEIDYEIRQKASVHAPIFQFVQPMSQTDACPPQPVVAQSAAPVITVPAITTSAILRPNSTKKRTVRPKKVLPIDPKQPKIMGFFVQEKPDMPSISSSSSIIAIDSDSDDGSSQSGLPEKKQRRS